MPDDYGNFKPISVPAAAWDRIFGPLTQPQKTSRAAKLDELTRLSQELEGGYR